jgi:hypothetical protein
MSSYRLARRSFFSAVGGAVGLKVLLSNMEAGAQGATAPPRFLMTHFPVGTLRNRFLPTGEGASYVASPIIQPFEDAGLRQDMTVFYGFSDGHLQCPGGGGHESGTPFTTTGCSAAGTRQNGGEGDDGVAGGPSFDQIFLRNVPSLSREDTGAGYVNAICDARVDSNETSTQCLSYGYIERSIASAVPGGNIAEYTPLLPQLSPAQLYAGLFSNFMPGGATNENQEVALRALRMRKSVLDYSLTELDQLGRIAPGAERPKIELHAEAIRKVEQQLASQIESGALGPENSCMLPTAPSSDLSGKNGNSQYLENVNSDDSEVHQAVAEAHSGLILAAFQCDLIRVATLQFSPGTNHVSFKGMWPSDPNRIAMHHPVSHAGAFLGGASSADPSGLSGADIDRYEFLANVQTWYNQRLADFLVKLKDADDGFGGSLLDSTVIPYVTEVAESNHSRGPKPAFLFGGSKLGLQHGTFQRFDSRPQVDLFLTCAQALMQTDDPKGGLGEERFNQFNQNAAAIAGLWAPPV